MKAMNLFKSLLILGISAVLFSSCQSNLGTLATNYKPTKKHLDLIKVDYTKPVIALNEPQLYTYNKTKVEQPDKIKYDLANHFDKANSKSVKNTKQKLSKTDKEQLSSFVEQYNANNKKKFSRREIIEDSYHAMPGKHGIDMPVLIILSIFIPPLAVYFYDDISDLFWISIILTLLFWLPGIIFALLVITGSVR